ncbi:hypothetical protein ACG7TL_001270 [Trametes sanguinea]
MLAIVSAALALAIVANIEVAEAVAGVSTFNDFSTQTTVACAGFPPTNSQGNGIFAAAMSDLSPLWQGATCQGTMDASKCNGQGSCVNCVGLLQRYMLPEFGGTIRPIEACEQPGVNALDIATTARSALSTFQQGNLNIDIEQTSC